MNLREYLKSLSIEEREKYAKACGTSVGYLKQIAGGHSKAGPALARKLHQHSSHQVALDKLRPDIWQPGAAA